MKLNILNLCAVLIFVKNVYIFQKNIKVTLLNCRIKKYKVEQ